MTRQRDIESSESMWRNPIRVIGLPLCPKVRIPWTPRRSWEEELVVHRLKDAHSAVQRYTPKKDVCSGDIDLPGLGTASGFNGHIDDTQTYYSYSGFSTPPRFTA